MAQDHIWQLAIFLSIVWAATLLYGEMFAFWMPPLWTCSWPHPSPSSYSSVISRADDHRDYMKIAVLADPQLMDRTSHNLAPKSLVLEIAQFYSDLYMRRAFLSSVLPFKPDMILFLGDYFDGGLLLSEEEWEESWSRFIHIFDLNRLESSTNIQIYYIPGNHDINYAAFHSHIPEVFRRYEKEFGSRNYRFKVGKVDFIAIDAQTIDGNSQGNLTSTTWNFVKNVSNDVDATPRVLLTHIPLYRPDWTPCGPHRASPIINQRISRADNQEIAYQNYVTQEKTNNLLDIIKPVLVLSGHDHDQCTVIHNSKHGPVKEHTVGTISWQQGNLYPSFMLLSASNITSLNGTHPDDAVLTNLCFLPQQTYIYIWYISLFVLTLLVSLFLPTHGFPLLHQFGDMVGYIRLLMNSNIFGDRTKEKNEEENCEYEMVWDAEGSMHLIKRSLTTTNTGSNEKNLVERGNAVMRSAARKQNAQVDVSVDVGLDTAVKLPLRTGKSKTQIVIRRLFRTLRVLTVITAVNIPLYMMLLFKDWIDK